ncbi:TonB-dependent receptor plug domain-containing protein [Niabella beijingensis]|uniref:TonB-dependent receptor plug domain-containing protein n=1 Tax=Niabella beijingensis TaxID=2872700 RepID=UPI001CC08467|nr:TonB-dependent receptor [Niabella beijingensis]MBZ4189529.1 TonB-dependent receptor [Niabella beijingensis]
MKRTALILLTLTVFINQNSRAQDTLLDPVTVTSSLVEKRSSETGRNITIISGETMAGLPVHSVDELLKYIPGVEAQMRGPQGSQTDISIRGGTFQQVLVILDGLRLNDPNTGHFTGYIPISPAEIDRIEVLKGASSAVYGSDAVGGVINIITKAFNKNMQTRKQQVSAQVAAGEYGLFNADAGGFYQNDKINVGAGLLTNNATGVAQRGIRGYFHNTAASAGLMVKLNPYWNLALRTAYDNRDFAAQNFYTTSASDTASEKIASWWNQARLQYQKGNTQLSADAGYKDMEDQYAFNPSAVANSNKSQLFQALATWQQRFSEQTQLVTGFNFQNREIRSNDRGNHSLNTAAPFVALIQQVGPHFTLNPSLRMELYGSLPAEWVPQLTASYKLNDLQLRASGGKTIRNADFTELYNNYNKTGVTGGSIGNPALQAERSWTYEAGLDWFCGSNLKISTSFFQRFHTGLIDWVNTPYAGMPRKENLIRDSSYALAKNVAAITTSGWEADAAYTRQFTDRQSLRLNGGFVWLYSRSSEPNPSFYILSHARFLANGMLTYTAGPVSISFTGIYKTRNPQAKTSIDAVITKDYFLLNGRASYSFLNDLFTAFIQADNLLDRQYSDLLGAPMPGRWMQGGLRFRFQK